MEKKFNENKQYKGNYNKGRTYVPKTNKPRPTTYEKFFDNGAASYNDALWTVMKDIPELEGFCDTIYVEDNTGENDKWFDESMKRVAAVLVDCAPELQNNKNIHTKLSLDVNGFSVRFENNITLDIHCRYEVVDGAAQIVSAHAMITTHGKVSKVAYDNLNETWQKKMYKPKYKKEFNKSEEE